MIHCNIIKRKLKMAYVLDESTDIQVSRMRIYCFVNQLFGGTSEEIFETLDAYVKSKELDWRNCVGICTDGARAMCRKDSGVVTRVLRQSPNASWTHCSIHREALVSKTISDDLKNVLNTAVKIINFIKSKRLQSRLFEKLCEEMGSCHKSLLFHSDVRWLSRGKVLTRLVELREEVAIFLKEQNGNYCCFETLATFIVEKVATLDEDLISMIVAHLDSLKESFDYYFSEEMKFCDKNIWIVNPFQGDVVATGISTKANEKLIDLSEDYSFKESFDRKRLKVLLSFTTSNMCKIGFSAMIGIKTKLRNKLQLSNTLRLKLTHISVDIEEDISQNRKQAHCSHTPHYASH
ncbi:Zinc finger BED domain-containing protein 5 [Trichinella spiralis]|uniref:Zinc finger BED domain-containing protein 5 n=1 Tax=Trichinella spiralis TaxID=6334 RepID=A0A0V1B6Z9_TRISP|nr:Zinc finger BED domain-containing protein 5 [Trichinella spiralis]